jgi:sugar phosphate isomerase/epimerase
VIEFLPWTTICDAGVAWQIAGSADRPNGGVLVDTWHHYRGAADDELIRAIPAEKIMAVHFNDADPEAVGDLFNDTIHHRRIPGEGSFDLLRFVRLLDEVGVTAPYSVEVLSDQLLDVKPAEVAKRVGDATRRIMAEARS